MPRVSEEHRERRREQILTAARRCFVRDGFHQTSMADIFAEAGLSAGAVYGYFKSKDAIINAITEEVVGRVAQMLRPIVERDPLPTLDQAILHGLRSAETLAFGEDGFGRLAPQVWAEATRNPGLADVVRAKYVDITEILTELAAAEQRVGRIAPDASPRQVATVLYGAILGYLIQRLLVDSVTPESYAAGFAALAAPASRR